MSIEILLDSGSRTHHNVGDVALLVACHDHLKALWPDAGISVLSEAPTRLRRVLPAARPVALEAKRPPAAWSDRLRPRIPRAVQRAIRARLPYRRPGLEPALRDAIEAAEVVALSGCGMLTDCHTGVAVRALQVLGAAGRRGKVVAMLGQGLGPIHDRRLRRSATSVLPGLHMLSVREPYYSPRLGADLGVPPSRIVLTGEEAVEMAHAARRACPGSGLGITLRIHPDVPFSARDEEALEAIRATLRASTAELGAPLHPIHATAADARAFRQHIAPEPTPPPWEPPTPAEAIASVAECRAVVTFSYHVAVFALAQGIPAIALVRNSFSAVRFTGLAASFRRGLRVLPVADRHLGESLARALREAWQTAESLRPELLAEAQRQIDQTRIAYEVFADIVSRR